MLVCALTGLGQYSFYKLYGGDQLDEGYDAIETADSGFIITGISGNFNQGHSDAFLLKIDKQGNYEWSAAYGGTENDGAFEMEYIENHGIYLVGRSNSLSGDYDAWLNFVDESGNELWSRTYPGENWEEFVDASLTIDSGLIVGVHNFGNETQEQDISILRLNSVGDTVWALDYSAPGDDEITNIEPYQDSLFVISSFHLDTATSYRYSFLRMLHEDGSTIWEDTVGIYPVYTRLSDFIISNDTLYGVGENIDDDTLNGDIYRLIYDVSIGGNGTISNGSSNSGDFFVADVITNLIGSSYRYISLRFKGEFTQPPGSDFYLALYEYNLVWISSFDYTDTPGEDRMLEAIPTSDGGAMYIGYQATNQGGRVIAVAKIGPGFDHPPVLGAFIVNPVVGSEELFLDGRVLLYPNPAKTEFNVDVSDVSINKYAVSNMNGEKLMFGDLQEGVNKLPVLDIANGFYILQLYSDDQFIGSKHFIVKH